MRAVRLCCILAALVVCAWFALGARQAIDTNRAQAIVSSADKLSSAQADRANALLASAATLNPDRQVDILKGQALLERGDARAAQQVLMAVTRAEPRNLDAWVKLAEASGNDLKLFQLALARVRALEPLFPFQPR
jgi:predicted Zn-dependent protease